MSDNLDMSYHPSNNIDVIVHIVEQRWKMEQPLMTLTSVLGNLRDLYKREFGVSFLYKIGEGENDELTLAQCSSELEEIKKWKTKMIGASNVRYAMAGNITNSLIKSLEKQADNVPEGFDRDLKLLLNAIPDELKKFNIELNSTCFYSTSIQVSAIPDGKCIIDGVVSPVELLTTNSARSKFTEAIRKNLNLQNTKERQANRKLEKAKSLHNLRVKKAKEKKDQNYKVKPMLSKRSKRIGKGRIGIKEEASLSNISVKSTSERVIQKFENRSIAQSKRRHLESLLFVEKESVEFMNQKKTQIQAQMFCMNAPKCLCIHWTEECVFYFISTYSPSFLTGMTTRKV